MKTCAHNTHSHLCLITHVIRSTMCFFFRQLTISLVEKYRRIFSSKLQFTFFFSIPTRFTMFLNVVADYFRNLRQWNTMRATSLQLFNYWQDWIIFPQFCCFACFEKNFASDLNLKIFQVTCNERSANLWFSAFKFNILHMFYLSLNVKLFVVGKFVIFDVKEL